MNRIMKVMTCILVLISLIGCSKQEKEPESEFAHSKRIASKDGLEIYIGDPQEGKTLYNLLFSIDVKKFEEDHDTKLTGEFITKVYEGEDLVGETKVAIPQELYEKGIDESFTYDMTLPKQPKEYSEFHVVICIEDKEIEIDIKNIY